MQLKTERVDFTVQKLPTNRRRTKSTFWQTARSRRYKRLNEHKILTNFRSSPKTRKSRVQDYRIHVLLVLRAQAITFGKGAIFRPSYLFDLNTKTN